MQPECHYLFYVRGGALRRAFEQESQAPAPLERIQPHSKQQGGVFFQQPAQGRGRRRRIGPGQGVRYGNLAAVCKTGFETGAGLTVHDSHLVPGFRKEPGGSRADDPGTENEYFHVVNSFMIPLGGDLHSLNDEKVLPRSSAIVEH